MPVADVRSLVAINVTITYTVTNHLTQAEAPSLLIFLQSEVVFIGPTWAERANILLA